MCTIFYQCSLTPATFKCPSIRSARPRTHISGCGARLCTCSRLNGDTRVMSLLWTSGLSLLLLKREARLRAPLRQQHAPRSRFGPNHLSNYSRGSSGITIIPPLSKESSQNNVIYLFLFVWSINSAVRKLQKTYDVIFQTIGLTKCPFPPLNAEWMWPEKSNLKWRKQIRKHMKTPRYNRLFILVWSISQDYSP